MVLDRLIPQEAELAPEAFDGAPQERGTGVPSQIKGEIRHGGGQKGTRDDTA